MNTPVKQEKLPIGTIRKAILWAAEEIAGKESFDVPKERHHKEALELMQNLKSIKPEAARKIILLAAEGKDIKDKLWKEKYKVFQQVMSDITHDIKKNLKVIFEEYFNDSNLNDKDEDVFIRETIKKYIDDKLVDFRNNDPRFIEVFEGDESLLDDLRKMLAEAMDMVQWL